MDSAATARIGRERSTAFLAACRRLAAALWEQAGIRVELLSLELAEERARIVGVLVAIATIVVGAALALAFAGLAALIAAWDTPYRVTVAVLFAAATASSRSAAAMTVRHLLGTHESAIPPFARRVAARCRRTSPRKSSPSP